MVWQKPEIAQIRAALRQYAPDLAEEPIEPLGEGWEFWAFRSGSHVLRFPKAESGFVWKLGDQSSTKSLQIERALSSVLADALPVRISVTEVYGEDGPNGAPFASHSFVPGELAAFAGRMPEQEFGRDLGNVLRKLHGFPARRALDLGVPLFDGPKLREDRAAHYEKVIRQTFPILSCEARTYVEQVYEAYLNDTASFGFEPVLVHTDLYVNMLIDTEGHLCGIIDFGDAAVSSPALDFWVPTYGFHQLGIANQEAACLDAAGIDGRELRRMLPELAFLDLRYPLLDILHGLLTNEDALVDDGIRHINVSLPTGLTCD